MRGLRGDQGNLAAKQGGVAIVDLDRVKEELGRDQVIQTSSTDFREEIKPIAEKVATERGLNTVVTKDNPFILSYGPNADITDAVIARIKTKRHRSRKLRRKKRPTTIRPNRNRAPRRKSLNRRRPGRGLHKWKHLRSICNCQAAGRENFDDGSLFTGKT